MSRALTGKNPERKHRNGALLLTAVITLIAITAMATPASAATGETITAPTTANPQYIQSGGSVSVGFSFTAEGTSDGFLIEIYNSSTWIGFKSVSYSGLTNGNTYSKTESVATTATATEGSYDVRITDNDEGTGSDIETDAVIVDDTPPDMVSAETKDTTTINVAFNEDLAGTFSKYDFSVSNTGTSYAVSSVTESSAGVVTVTTSSALPKNATPVVNYTNTNGNLTDLAGNPAGTQEITASDGVPPSEATNEAATAEPNGAINVSWTASTSPGDIDHYNIYRNSSGTIDYSADLLTTVPAGTTSYVDTATTDGTTYTYAVRAEDAAGNIDTDITTMVSATADADATPPKITSITNNDPDEVYANGSTLSFNVTSDSAGYTVTANMSNLDSGYTSGDESVTDNNNTYTVTYTISATNTRADGTYDIPVTVTDTAGNENTSTAYNVTLDNSKATNLTVDSPASQTYTRTDNPSFVVNYSYNDANPGAVTIVLDDGLGNTSTYSFSDSGYAGDNTLAGQALNLSSGGTPANLIAGHTYSITVTVTDLAGNSASANTSKIVQMDDADPSVVTNLSVTNTPGMNQLNWDAASDNGAIDYYKIYRNTTAGSLSAIDTSDVGSAGTNGGSLIDTTTNTYYNDTARELEPGTTYYYTVTAVDKADNEGSQATLNSTEFVGIPVKIVVSGPSSLVADGASTGTITATVTDQYGRPVPGIVVAFSTDTGTLTPTENTTNSSGEASVTLYSSFDVETATITASNGSLNNTTQVDFVEDTYNVSLNAGWNLISLPLMPDDESVNTVLGDMDNVEIVWAYDNGNWSVYSSAGPDTLSTMEDGKGYWVKMSAPENLTVKGFSRGAAPVAYDIEKGWNLIGYTSTTPGSAEKYLTGGDLTIGDIGPVFKYDENGDTLININITGDNLEPGLGYWMYAKKPGEIAPNAG